MKKPPITAHPNYIRARGIMGAFFVLFGLVIGFEILHGVGLRFEAVPGVALGAAMIALGIVRIKAALRLRSAP